MAEKKIILCDIDGTLVDYDNNLPASAVDAIHKAQKSLGMKPEDDSITLTGIGLLIQKLRGE